MAERDFANLALHCFVATHLPLSLPTLEVLSTVGATSSRLDERVAAEGFTTLEDLEAHYTGGDSPMSPLNYVWYQYRWQRIAAAVYLADGDAALRKLFLAFQTDAEYSIAAAPVDLTAYLFTCVSSVLGESVANWDAGRASHLG